MRNALLAGFISLLAASGIACNAAAALPPLPDREGFAGAYAGVSGGAWGRAAASRRSISASCSGSVTGA